jgi:hypothetical protein
MTMTRQQQLQEDTHFRVLSLLESQPDLNQRALTGRFLKRKQEEYAALKAEIEALQKAVAENSESGQ